VPDDVGECLGDSEVHDGLHGLPVPVRCRRWSAGVGTPQRAVTAVRAPARPRRRGSADKRFGSHPGVRSSPLRFLSCASRRSFLQELPRSADYRTMPAGPRQAASRWIPAGPGAVVQVAFDPAQLCAVRVEHVRPGAVNTATRSASCSAGERDSTARQIRACREPSAGSTRMPARRSGGLQWTEGEGGRPAVTGTSMNGRGRFSGSNAHHSAVATAAARRCPRTAGAGSPNANPVMACHRQPEQSRPVDGPAQARRPADAGAERDVIGVPSSRPARSRCQSAKAGRAAERTAAGARAPCRDPGGQ